MASSCRLIIRPVKARCSVMRRGVAQEMAEYKARSMFSIKHAAETMSTPEATCERSKPCLISSVHATMARPRQKLAGDGSSVSALNLTFSTLACGLSPEVLPSTLPTGECGPVASGDRSRLHSFPNSEPNPRCLLDDLFQLN